MIHGVRIGQKTRGKNRFEQLVVCYSATRLKQLKRLQESSILSCVAFITLVSEVGFKVTKE